MTMKEIKKNEKVIKEWAPNENQKRFLKALADYDTGAMLVDIEIDKGLKVPTGVVTPLVNRGLIETIDVERISNIVYRDTIIGRKTDHVKKYKLVKGVK